MYETCKNTQIELQHFCSPKKAVPTVFARYNREQLGKYTGKLIVTTDPGIRVWYGMVVYQKDGKTCEGSPLSALQAYNQIISLFFPYCSLLFPYFSPIVPGETWRTHILSVENLLNISKLKKIDRRRFFWWCFCIILSVKPFAHSVVGRLFQK